MKTCPFFLPFLSTSLKVNEVNFSGHNIVQYFLKQLSIYWKSSLYRTLEYILNLNSFDFPIWIFKFCY